MTDNDKEIVQTLKNHIEAEDCVTCESFGRCDEFILTEKVLDLINRQQAEIERLEKESEDKESAYTDEYCLRKEWQRKCKELLEEKYVAKSETVREFAEKLKERNEDFCVDKSDMAFVVDSLVKEMAGDTE